MSDGGKTEVGGLERLSPAARGARPTHPRAQRPGPGAGGRLSLPKAALVLPASNQLFGFLIAEAPRLSGHRHTMPTRADSAVQCEQRTQRCV